MEEEPKTYVQGFNDAYRLNKYNPHLYEMLKGTMSGQSDYELGFEAGGLQAEREREQERQSELDDLRGEQEPEQEMER